MVNFLIRKKNDSKIPGQKMSEFTQISISDSDNSLYSTPSKDISSRLHRTILFQHSMSKKSSPSKCLGVHLLYKIPVLKEATCQEQQSIEIFKEKEKEAWNAQNSWTDHSISAGFGSSISRLVRKEIL
jgi:hypothetical protein